MFIMWKGMDTSHHQTANIYFVKLLIQKATPSAQYWPADGTAILPLLCHQIEGLSYIYRANFKSVKIY